MLVEKEELEKWIALLRAVRFFQPFEQEDLEHMLKVGQVHLYNATEYIFREHDLDMSFCVVLRGSVKLFKAGPLNTDKELTTLHAGDCFGEMGLLLHDKRSATVRAAEECFLFRINDDDIEKMPDQTKTNLYHRFAKYLASRLKGTTEKIINPNKK